MCTVIVLTLGALSSNPLISQARDVSARADHFESLNAQTTPPNHQTGESATALPNAVEPTSSDRSRIDGNSDHASETQSAPSDHTTSATSDQTGCGVGRTNEASAQSDLAGTSDTGSAPRGDLASGGGQTSATGSAGASVSSPASDSHANQPAPPWKSSDWPKAQQRASEQIHNGDVPDAYRDLVRDYFSR